MIKLHGPSPDEFRKPGGRGRASVGGWREQLAEEGDPLIHAPRVVDPAVICGKTIPLGSMMLEQHGEATARQRR